MGLAAPQITYIMHALKEKGLDVDVTATTVDEAKENILAVLRNVIPGSCPVTDNLFQTVSRKKKMPKQKP